jgi:ribonuclease HII
VLPVDPEPHLPYIDTMPVRSPAAISRLLRGKHVDERVRVERVCRSRDRAVQSVVMLVYAGIDEAGYGPMLGPLCVGASIFVLDDADPAEGAPDLWSLLRDAVCRERRDRRRRIAIDDSKKLKCTTRTGRTHPLRALERGVLSMLGTIGDDLPTDDAELWARLGTALDEQPWYDSRTPVPLAETVDALRIDAARLGRVMHKAAVSCAALRCEVVDAGAFNRQIERLGRKSQVNFAAVMRLVEVVRRRFGDRHPRIVVDKQGARIRYLDDLRLAYPDANLRILAEDERISRYRLSCAAWTMTISFEQGSESRHLPAALASMTAKYVRELAMLRLNRFFTTRLPELKPTAGYVSDGRRYVREIEPLLRELALPRAELIRRR